MNLPPLEHDPITEMFIDQNGTPGWDLENIAALIENADGSPVDVAAMPCFRELASRVW